MTQTEIRTIEEAYCTATATVDLRVSADHQGDGDVLIAAGWSPSRLGAGLLRLRAEWDATAKPRRPTKQQIAELAKASRKPGQKEGAAVAEAKASAQSWYMHEVVLQLSACRMLPAVKDQVTRVAAAWGIEDHVHVAADALLAWLDDVCPACDGRKYQFIPGGGALSNRLCGGCAGTGRRLPAGQDGRRLMNHLDKCVGCASYSIRGRLRNMPLSA